MKPLEEWVHFMGRISSTLSSFFGFVLTNGPYRAVVGVISISIQHPRSTPKMRWLLEGWNQKKSSNTGFLSPLMTLCVREVCVRMYMWRNVANTFHGFVRVAPKSMMVASSCAESFVSWTFFPLGTHHQERKSWEIISSFSLKRMKWTNSKCPELVQLII